MSSVPTTDVNAVIDSIPTRRVPAAALVAGLAAIGVGVIAVCYGFGTGQTAWTWGAILVGILYVLALGQGGMVFSLILTLTEARWGRSLKRIAEAFAFVLPVAWVALFIFLIGGQGIYAWNHSAWFGNLVPLVDLEPHSELAAYSKPIWLSFPFFFARQVFGTLLLFALDAAYIYFSLKPDLMMAKARLGSRAPAWWAIIAGSGDVSKEAVKGEKSQKTLGVIIAILYAFLFSMLAFDLVMSLDPHWAANMFGAWFFASCVWMSLCMLGIYSLLARDWLGLTAYIRPRQMHDLGKIITAFTMFWAYTGFAMLLPIYYTQIIEEIGFPLMRLATPAWGWMARVVGVMCFVMPFTVIISRGIKKMKWPFIGILSVILVGLFLERTLLVMPSITEDVEHFAWGNFTFVSIGTWIGFLGAFVTVVTQVLARIPPLVVSDPKLEAHPWDVHVHSLDPHDAGHAHAHAHAHADSGHHP